jgi:hypothetical protein
MVDKIGTKSFYISPKFMPRCGMERFTAWLRMLRPEIAKSELPDFS